ncbi:MAG TPA: hypothetical protein VIR45_10965 [Kiloniellaceae bacterium]
MDHKERRRHCTGQAGADGDANCGWRKSDLGELDAGQDPDHACHHGAQERRDIEDAAVGHRRAPEVRDGSWRGRRNVPGRAVQQLADNRRFQTSQLGEHSRRDKAAVFHHGDAIAQQGRLADVVRDVEDRGLQLGKQPAEERDQLAPQNEIEVL